NACPKKEMLARQLLQRTGVVFRKTISRERLPITWSALCRIYRLMELRGEARGGRFVAGFSGEQFALPEAVDQMRRVRREGLREPGENASIDPLSLRAVLTPDDQIAVSPAREVLVG